MKNVVVTRHPALLDFLIEEGIVQEGNFLLIAQAKAEDVEGKDVIGNLPLHLAAMAHTITEVPLKIPFELRGKELTLKEIRKYAGDPVTYNVDRSRPLKKKMAYEIWKRIKVCNTRDQAVAELFSLGYIEREHPDFPGDKVNIKPYWPDWIDLKEK